MQPAAFPSPHRFPAKNAADAVLLWSEYLPHPG